MAKISVLVFISLTLLFSCASNSWDDYDNLYAKIYHWQNREKECLEEERHLIHPVQEIDISELWELRDNTMSGFQPISDEEDCDYWQTSCETKDRGEGDCEDFAILVLSELGVCYPNHRVGVLIITYIRNDERKGHATPIIYYCDDDFLILDRGWGVIAGQKLRAKNLTDLKFKLAFNLKEIWFI